MKYLEPVDPIQGTQDHLLISCVNGGGLVYSGPNGIEIIDHINTIGLYTDKENVIRAYQTETGSRIDVLNSESHKELNLEVGSDIHDILLHEEHIYIVSTGTNEVLVCDSKGKLVNTFSFQGEGDSWHLNCLSIVDNKVAISAFGNFKKFRGWSQGQYKEQGIVFFLEDTPGFTPIISGLSQPHTPRQHQDKLYCCDSAAQKLIRLHSEGQDSIPFPGYYPRGMTCTDEFIYLGLSSSRNIKSDQVSSILVTIDTKNFSIISTTPLPFREIYDIAIISPSQAKAVKKYYESAKASILSKIQHLEYYNQNEVRLERSLEEQENIIASLHREREESTKKVLRMQKSFSWRVTKPLRATRRLLMKLINTRMYPPNSDEL